MEDKEDIEVTQCEEILVTNADEQHTTNTTLELHDDVNNMNIDSTHAII